MASIQDRLSPPRKPWKDLKARKYASCTTSCASWSLRVNQRAKLYAASRYGKISCSKRTRWLDSGTSFAFYLPERLIDVFSDPIPTILVQKCSSRLYASLSINKTEQIQRESLLIIKTRYKRNISLTNSSFAQIHCSVSFSSAYPDRFSAEIFPQQTPKQTRHVWTRAICRVILWWKQRKRWHTTASSENEHTVW